jgi:antitoxin (DNA-binding transcriptional repressor) of toxin-antitoxin stability system
MKATTLDLRYRTKDVLKAVERGETITILYRGQAKAQIVPLASSNATALRTGEAFGLWKDRKDMGDVSAYVMKLRKTRFRDL